jgi:hypothetical protein
VDGIGYRVCLLCGGTGPFGSNGGGIGLIAGAKTVRGGILRSSGGGIGGLR